MNENEKIDFLLQELATLPAINDESARKLEDKFRLEFSFNSNHLEGNTLTYGETRLLLIFDKTNGPHEMREFEEMKAHDVAYRWIKELAQDKSHRLIERDIKQLNQIILVRPFWKEAITPDHQKTRKQILVGEYKQQDNIVLLPNGEEFHYTSAMNTPMAMDDLLNWFHKEVEKKELSALELAAIFHYKFVLIHPFDDGNGRISRLLMNYVLLRNALPPVIIKSADKKNYLNALNQADSGNLPAFINYIAQQLIWSLEITLKATKGESIEEEDDIDKQVSLFKKEQLNFLNKNPLKTKDLVHKVYTDFTKILLKELYSKLLVFDDLFTQIDSEYTIIIVFPNGAEIIKRIRNYKEIENLLKEEGIIKTISWDKNYKISLNGKIPDSKFTLTIQFNQNNYVTKLDGTENIVKLSYSQSLTNSEILKIINDMYKDIFKIIQDNSKKGVQ